LPRDLSNRFTYHPPFGDQVERYQALRTLGRELAESIDEICPDSDEKDRALDHLDQVIFLSNAAIARHEDDPND
jgi:hypothetical protein